MSEPFVGEVRAVGFNFAPQGWFLCNGQLIPISEYSTLFNLVGITYGGDGINTFAVPNLNGRTPIHFGSGLAGVQFAQGQLAGAEYVTLNVNQLPAHSHNFVVDTATGSAPSPSNNFLAASSAGQFAASGASATASILSANGGNQSHENRQPYLCINYIIAWAGVYPSQN